MSRAGTRAGALEAVIRRKGHIVGNAGAARLVLPPDTPLAAARERMDRAEIGEAAVAEADGTLVGLLTMRSLARATEKGQTTARAAAVATISVESDETLDTALGLLAQYGVHRIPVVNAETPACLAGMLTTEGITRAYAAHSNDDARRREALAPGATLQEIALAHGDAAVGRAVRDLGLPAQALIISVRRHGQVIIPRGDTVLAAGDRLALAVAAAALPAVIAALRGQP